MKIRGIPGTIQFSLSDETNYIYTSMRVDQIPPADSEDHGEVINW